MNRALLAIAILIILSVGMFAGIVFTNYNPLLSTSSNLPKAYVGVTYGGNSVAEGKQLIDKVKGYTNLFVLASGLLERDLTSVDELGDYAIAQGMYFLPYFGNFVQSTFLDWLQTAKDRWRSHLLGIYYSDEPAGKMLDGYVEFKDAVTGDTITKTQYGDIAVQKSNGIVIQYLINGDIKLYQPDGQSDINNEVAFYANGSIGIIRAQNGLADFTYRSYQELNGTKPFKTLAEAAERFTTRDESNIAAAKTNNTKVFTSDYALYWFDYLSGYDVVLGQIGWNMTFNQQIALLRGAATAQNKEWGIVITWKYQQPPYLDNGTTIYNQMRSAYECGAKYLVLFNYYDDSNSSSYGTLKEEHFQALQSFWNNVFHNSKEIQGSTKADSVLIMPENYGWGTRWATDHIWGIFPADHETLQIWILMQNASKEQGLKLDIVYADNRFPFASVYGQIYRLG